MCKFKGKLLVDLEQGLFNVIVAGKPSVDLVREIQGIFGSEYYIAKRLVHTEIAYIQTQSSLERYKRSGLSEYKYFTLRDEKVCEDCKEIDGKVFKIDEAKVGVNCPPTHPNCRCFISPVINITKK